jgi:hypothetical protein
VCRLRVVNLMKIAASACETMVMAMGFGIDLINKWYKDCGLKRSQKP